MSAAPPPPGTDLQALLAWGRQALVATASPALDARLLLQAVSGLDATGLYLHAAGRAADATLRQHYGRLIARRAAGEPVAYLLGRREFWSLDLQVTPATLVPRPDTELLVETALALTADAALEVAEPGTGSGAIALALASERPGWRITASDIDPAALAVAKANGRRLGLAGVRWLCGAWCAPLAAARFALVVSNPPYVQAGDPALSTGPLRFEPRRALAAGPDGLAAIRELCATGPRVLRPGGHLLLEHGCSQGPAVRALLRAAGFQAVATRRDLGGLERVSHGRLAA